MCHGGIVTLVLSCVNFVIDGGKSRLKKERGGGGGRGKVGKLCAIFRCGYRDKAFDVAEMFSLCVRRCKSAMVCVSHSRIPLVKCFGFVLSENVS